MMATDFDFSSFSFGPDSEMVGMDTALITPSEVRNVHSRRIASLQDLNGFVRVSSETLVHKSEKDLWVIKKDKTGFVIERLFDETGEPLKG
jgi:hypothetical protein